MDPDHSEDEECLQNTSRPSLERHRLASGRIVIFHFYDSRYGPGKRERTSKLTGLGTSGDGLFGDVESFDGKEPGRNGVLSSSH